MLDNDGVTCYLPASQNRRLCSAQPVDWRVREGEVAGRTLANAYFSRVCSETFRHHHFIVIIASDIIISPRELTFTWWACCDLCF